DGDLGPDATAVIDAALTAADAALTAARGTDPDNEAPSRWGSQRRADALAEVCRFYTDHTDCESPRRARTPQLMALIDMPDLYRAALYGAGIHHPGDLDRFLTTRRLAGQPVSAVEEAFLRHALDHATGRATTIDGHRLSPEAVTTIFGAGTTLERVMLADSQVLDHGRQVRLATGPLRDVMLARDGGCRFPTPTGERCDAPVAWINGHHITHWKHGGPTSLRNLLALCANHHGVVHRDGWDITIDDHGTVTVTRPDGTTLTSPPPHTRRPPRLPLHRDSDHAGPYEAAPGTGSTAAKDTADDGAPRPNPTDENDGDDESDENRADPGVCGYAQARLTLTARLPEAQAAGRTPNRTHHTDERVVAAVGRPLRPAARARRDASPGRHLEDDPSSSGHLSDATAVRLRSIRDHVQHPPTSRDDGSDPALHQRWPLGRGRRQGSRAPDLITRTRDGALVAVYVTAA
ncbi:HNH endonuclease, partial [Rhabdothermincola salaria]|uniref:HNH endonuclease n=1 Tax=Rhabdothermincola salaria TaxID=2903142 RepID=UPI001E316E44